MMCARPTLIVLLLLLAGCGGNTDMPDQSADLLGVGTLYVHPADTLILRNVRASGDQLDVYGAKDDNGTVYQVEFIRQVTTNPPQTTLVSFDTRRRIKSIVSDDGTVIELIWRATNQADVTVISPRGVILESNTIEFEASMAQAERDAVGVACSFEPASNFANTTPTEQVRVELSDCTGSTESEVVWIVLNDFDRLFPAQRRVSGAYTADLPVAGQNEFSAEPSACPGNVQVLQAYCSFCESVDAASICAGIDVAVDTLNPFGQDQAQAVAQACQNSITLMNTYCERLAYSPDSGNPTAEDVCQQLVTDSQMYDVATATLEATALIPGSDAVWYTSEQFDIPDSGPLPSVVSISTCEN